MLFLFSCSNEQRKKQEIQNNFLLRADFDKEWKFYEGMSDDGDFTQEIIGDTLYIPFIARNSNDQSLEIILRSNSKLFFEWKDSLYRSIRTYESKSPAECNELIISFLYKGKKVDFSYCVTGENTNPTDFSNKKLLYIDYSTLNSKIHVVYNQELSSPVISPHPIYGGKNIDTTNYLYMSSEIIDFESSDRKFKLYSSENLSPEKIKLKGCYKTPNNSKTWVLFYAYLEGLQKVDCDK